MIAAPLSETALLARALFGHIKWGDEIPEKLCTGVAEVLAYVIQLKTHRERGGIRPSMPTELEVPPDMDPNNSKSAATPS